MAKGYALVGNIKGKLGGNVFFTIKNSNNKVTQGVRAYQPSVSNPRSSGQVLQRMKLLAANNFYRALSDILDHSFEGVQYGGRSHQYFMQEALRMKEGYPYLIKGNTQPVPGKYLISKGSIPQVIAANPNAGSGLIVTTLVHSAEEVSNFGGLSSLFIKNNPFLNDGDQLTFIAVGRQSATVGDVDQGFVYSAIKSRIVLDVNSTSTLEEAGVFDIDVIDGRLAIQPTNFSVPDFTRMGVAVVLSRWDENSKQWKRSTSYMQVASDIVINFMSANAYATAAASYASADTVPESTRYLNNAGDDSSSGTGTSELELINGSAMIGNTAVSTVQVVSSPDSTMVGQPVFVIKALPDANFYHAIKVDGLTISHNGSWSDSVRPASGIVLSREQATSGLWAKYTFNVDWEDERP